MKTSRLWIAMLAGVCIVASGGTWVALNTISAIEQATDERESWIVIDSTLFELSNDVSALVTETQGSALDDTPVIVDESDLHDDFDRMISTLRTQTELVVEPEDRAEFDVVIDRVATDLDDIVSSVRVVANAQDLGLSSQLDRRLQRLLNEHQALQLHLEDLYDVRFDAEAARLASFADDSSRRFDLVILASLPIVALVVALIRTGRRSERRAARLTRRLDRERRRAQAIVDSIPTGVAWIGRNGRVLGLNRRMRDVFSSWTSAEPVGSTPTDLSTAEWAATATIIERLAERTLEDGGVHSDELHEVRDGTSRTVRLVASPFVEGDEIVGAIVLGEDVTDERENERALAMSGRMESIGQLAAGVAHEINTPVQFVTDNVRFIGEAFDDVVEVVEPLAELARRSDVAAADELVKRSELVFLRDEVPSAVAQSLDGLTRVSEIVGAMNNFSHPSSETAVVDVNAVVGTAVAVARGEWRPVAEVDLVLDAERPVVDGREGDLKQVMLNLIVNASHAIADARLDRPGRLMVETIVDDDTVRIRVRDDGVGMGDDVRRRIFDQFFTTKPVGRGTGQGLSMAWDIVASHGGSIDVDSAPGSGTTFTVNLPVHRSAAAGTGEDRRERSVAGVAP